MLNCFEKSTKDKVIPITLIPKSKFQSWLKDQSLQVRSWVEGTGFSAKPGTHCLLPDAAGCYAHVLLGVNDEHDVWQLGALPLTLPEGVYSLENQLQGDDMQYALTAWGMGAYQFTDYKDADRFPAKLLLPKNAGFELVENIVESIYLVRDLINVPPEDMGPLELAEVAAELGKQFQASVTQIVGEELLDEMYPAIYTVGRGSYNMPRLIDLQWGDEAAPKLTLVGKGVCFDTGGLDIKTASGMALMKKDMGGAAHVLGLARMIMKANLPVRLRVLVPAVENAVSSDAYRPSDIITMRNGKTVEVGNTDAEGRLVLADALVEACVEKPNLLIDFATLTGAARVSVGTEIAAMFSNQKTLAKSLVGFGEQNEDPIWQLPLYDGYRKLLNSDIADISNCGTIPYAGAITAALFLKEFVDQDIPWAHFDIMAWNLDNRPAHPKGGEAMALRAVFEYLRQRFSAQH